MALTLGLTTCVSAGDLVFAKNSLSSQAHSGAEGTCYSLLSAWLLLVGDLLICILWQELSHWSSKLSRENPSTGETHAGLMRGPPAINQQEQCILGGGEFPA